MKQMIKRQLISFYRLPTLGLAFLLINTAISPIAQAQTQAQTQPISDPSEIPAQPAPEPADQIPEVFTPQVPSIEQDTIQLQQQLEQDNAPPQGSFNGGESELNQINNEEQQLEQNDLEQNDLEQNDQEQLDQVGQPSSSPSPSNP